jgi:uncharacterized protein YlxW (UPF0749 family)
LFGPAGEVFGLDGDHVAAPYEIAAIGPADELAEAMRLPGGPLTVIGASPGVEVRIRTESGMTLPATRRTPAFEHARAAG